MRFWCSRGKRTPERKAKLVSVYHTRRIFSLLIWVTFNYATMLSNSLAAVTCTSTPGGSATRSFCC